MHQFIMPLFLAVLIRNAKNFSAINHDNESLGVCLDWENMKLPKGYPVEKLVNAVREHWFTTDSRARIAEDADSGYVYW
ncbi:hypothetical protein BW247_04940 [Acidihalobacter ferrooxydans]|uniref:Uncharacterized protein n=2 Tax=Acidihalobacter ferrooxydans TaxID=1765967 RepID=A0A1P8UF96_9GAMM|nr:hypothetical protein BW247_04940 [Acidihalobacter ferrooxydans]